MRGTLHADDVDRYRREGILFPISVLTEEEVRSYRSALEEVEVLNGGSMKRLDNAHLFFSCGPSPGHPRGRRRGRRLDTRRRPSDLRDPGLMQVP